MSQKSNNWDPTNKKIQDQRKAYDSMREKCPVAHTGDQTWWIFQHKDLQQILEDHETFSNSVSTHTSVPNGMDPPEHTKYRKIIEPYFSTDFIQKYKENFRSIAGELVKNALTSDTPDVMSDIALPYAARVQCAFLGWPDLLSKPLIQWTLSNQQAVRKKDRTRLSVLADDFNKLIYQIIDERVNLEGKEPKTVTESLLQEEVDGRQLNHEELSSIFRNWTVGEVGSISASVGIIMHYLANHESLQRILRETPALITDAVDEILRLHGPLVVNRRKATRPVNIEDKKIKKGDTLYINWISANRDGETFDQPDTFRLDRNPDDNLLYGKGIHKCPGAPLARMELSVFVEELFDQTITINPHPGASPQKAAYPASGFSHLPLTLN